MNKSTKTIVKVIIKILKFAASQFEVMLREEEENQKTS
jgi:hypothetical protein